MEEDVKRLANSYMKWGSDVTYENLEKLTRWAGEAGPGCEVRMRLGLSKQGHLTLQHGVFDKNGKQFGEWLNITFLCPPFC